MAYTHGVYIYERPTSVIAPITADSAVQFVVGTAPINLLEDPASAVNKPILINNFAEAVQKLGYSDSFDKYTLCQSMDASFRVYNVAPLVMVNVLDPTVHITTKVSESHDIEAGQILIEEEGILLDDTFVVEKVDDTTGTPFQKDLDYTVEFNTDGHVLLKVLEGGGMGSEASVEITYTQLDPSQVEATDIIGGYNKETGVYTGLELISQVYPRLAIIPGLILCPGWSHLPEVGVAMSAKCEAINGSFNCQAVKDVDTTPGTGAVEYTAVNTWKNNNSYTGKHDIVCWP